ncbi:hypothetical protein O181_041357 [Austropuccinia psidii MF-1]|uniref:Uncharacterized protein n=1 Tax=Austropuccinia psidii MF-1 TaxID=1389203 RepID=A0A9Q3HES5_9BASI|nr:hypothetical protein [Austropuccinia psidii MF-1]
MEKDTKLLFFSCCWPQVVIGDGLGCVIGDGFICESRKGLEVEGLGEGGGMEDGSEDTTGGNPRFQPPFTHHKFDEDQSSLKKPWNRASPIN